ncbi:MAG: HAD hydrolase-like protein [Chloroflexi bacterium]|nr:HAD hydrolase-like protein [Chloroflexota bacterium]
MTHLRTILFDLDGTLIVDQVSLVTQFFQYCNRLGHDTAGDMYRELYRWRHEFWVDSDRINADFKRFGERGFWVEYHKQQLNFMGLNGSLDDHAEQITHWFYEDGSHRTVTVAMKMANSAPDSTVYVGDNYFIDIIGARNVGITPILIDPENIFPDAECKVIRTLKELRSLV